MPDGICGSVHPEREDVTCMAIGPHVMHNAIVHNIEWDRIFWPNKDVVRGTSRTTADPSDLVDSVSKTEPRAHTTTAREEVERVGAPYQQHSPTSKDAARSILDNISPDHARLLGLFADKGPHTDEAIALALDMNPSTARPRRVELMDAGWVVQVGRARNRSGRYAATWDIATGIAPVPPVAPDDDGLQNFE